MLRDYKLVNNRKVLYLEIGMDLAEFEATDLSNWAVYVIEDDAKNPLLPTFASLCIKKNVVYMSSTGAACSIVDDIFDETFVDLEIGGGDLPSWIHSEEDVLMTTRHYNFGEGFWFITTVANNGNVPIETVLVANFTRVDRSLDVEKLVIDINNGWIPED
jgi:hypothetical protein